MSEEMRDRDPRYRSSWTSDPFRLGFGFLGIVILAALLLDKSSFSARAEQRETPDSNFSDVAVMGGVKRHSDGAPFRGGAAKAIMGAVDIDLRDATMERFETTLDVSTIMGGVKLRVPRDWTVVSHVDTVLGGFEDATHHPREEAHRLILEGTVVMGGLKVEN